jgi:hypothetical protein
MSTGGYHPVAELATVVIDGDSWAVRLSPQATVVELACLLFTLGGGERVKVQAVDMGRGAFAVVPIAASMKAPTAADIARAMEHWTGPVPSLVSIGGSRRATL